MKICLFAVAAAALVIPTAIASELDFVLVNNTGHPLRAIYVSSGDDNDWNNNLLPDGASVPDRGSIKVQFETRPQTAVWDIRVVDESETSLIFRKINLIDAEKVVLQAADGKPEAAVE